MQVCKVGQSVWIQYLLQKKTTQINHNISNSIYQKYSILPDHLDSLILNILTFHELMTFFLSIHTWTASISSSIVRDSFKVIQISAQDRENEKSEYRDGQKKGRKMQMLMEVIITEAEDRKRAVSGMWTDSASKGTWKQIILSEKSKSKRERKELHQISGTHLENPSLNSLKSSKASC